MTDYTNWKILISEADEKADEYTKVAEWCNENGEYHIEQQGEYYAVVVNMPPTEEELKSQVRAVRDAYLQHYDFTQLPDAPFNEIEKAQYVNYRQYLRDYTLLDNWWLSNPKTFEEWLNSIDNNL